MSFGGVFTDPKTSTFTFAAVLFLLATAVRMVRNRDANSPLFANREETASAAAAAANIAAGVLVVFWILGLASVEALERASGLLFVLVLVSTTHEVANLWDWTATTSGGPPAGDPPGSGGKE